MDVVRTKGSRARKLGRILWIILSVAAAGGATYWLAGLRPAFPMVERGTLWTGKVQQGPLVISVRGTGKLVPENIRWISTNTEGLIEKIFVKVGQAVTAETVLMELSNPERVQAAIDAEWSLRAAEAELASLKAQLQNRLLEYRSVAAAVQSEQTQAQLKLEMNESLAKDGLVADIDVRFSQIKSRELTGRLQMEREKIDEFNRSIKTQLAVQYAHVAQLRELLRLRKEQVSTLRVRAGLSGVLQELPAETGQRVQPGHNLAKVAQVSPLKAELLIPEFQAKDIQIGQKVTVDTRNTLIPGQVVRIDPAVRNGTVKIDVTLNGSLPMDARPDLSVDGAIELAHLNRVLFCNRPAAAQPGQCIKVFRVNADKKSAMQTTLRIGRCGIDTMEILEGVHEGDELILSDMTQWDASPQIRLQ